MKCKDRMTMNKANIYVPEEIQRHIFHYEHQLRMKEVLDEFNEYNTWTCDECDCEYHMKDGKEFRIHNMMFNVCGGYCVSSVEYDYRKFMNARFHFQTNQNQNQN